MWFQKLSIPPPRKGFFPSPPLPPPSTSLEIPVKLHTFTYIFGPLRTPQPPRISNPFHGGSMDIFWNYTFSIFLFLLALVVHELGLGDKGNQPRLKKIWIQFWPVKSTLYCTRQLFEPTWNAIWYFVNKAQNWSKSFIHIKHFTRAVGQGWGPVLMPK